MKTHRCSSLFVTILIVLTLIGNLSGCATSEKIPIPKVEQDVYIYDQDDVIDDVVEKQLNQMLVELEEKTEAEFVVVSVQSLLNRDIETYANNLFNTLGIGKKGKDNGVLLLFSRSDKRVRLEIGRGLEGCLNDSKCGRILDTHFVPYRENDEYSKATEMTVASVISVIAEEYDVTINGLDTPNFKNLQPEETEEPVELTIGELILIIIIITVILVIAEWLTGCLFGDGFGDGIVFAILSESSSSGFGGGFSGFGGGFSGGGGASR